MTRGNLFSELTYASELEVRIRKVRLAENEEGYFSKCLRSPEDTYNLFKAFFDKSPVELFLVLHLKTNTRLSAFEIVSKGILNQTLVHPREVFKSAILRNAASIIIAHNHPSGNSEPSKEDIAITKQVADAGKIIGIPLVDHIIFTSEKYYSFAEHGHL